MMKKKIKLDNRGLSLIEMMIVVAIIVVVSGIVAYSYSMVSTKQVDQCAKRIQINLESCRTTTMGKFDADLQFKLESGKIILVKNIYNKSGTVTTKVELGGSDLIVKYVLTDGATFATNNLTSTPFVVKFDRASGSLKADATGKYVSEFIVENTNGTKTLHVRIDKLTGRVTVE